MKLQAGVQSQTFRSKLSFMRSTAGKTKLAESLAWPTDAAGLALKKGNGKPEGTLPTLKSQTKKRMIWPSCWVRGLALHRRLLRGGASVPVKEFCFDNTRLFPIRKPPFPQD